MKQIALIAFFGAIIISQFAWAQGGGTVESRGMLIPQRTVSPPSSRSFIAIPYPNVGSARLPPDLAAISTVLAEDKPPAVVLDIWKGYVTRQVQSR